jgi:hypothetical protein
MGELAQTIANSNCSAEERFEAIKEMGILVLQLLYGDLDEVEKTKSFGEGSILGMIGDLTQELKRVSSENAKLEKAKILLKDGGLTDYQRKALVRSIAEDLIPAEPFPKPQQAVNDTNIQIFSCKEVPQFVPVRQNPKYPNSSPLN